MQIYVVRHGETRSNVEGRLQGQSNDALNENGVRLAAVTGQGMREIHFDECITSPLIRAADTARIILQESGNENTPVVYDDRLKEISFGIYEGKKIGVDDIQTEAMKSFLHDPLNFPGLEGGETIKQVCTRTQEFLKEMQSRGKRLGIATSNGSLMVNTVLDALDLKKFLDVVVTACEVPRGKPFPDIYLKTAGDLGVIPEKCLVFEDIPEGIIAGKRAGMTVCAMRDEFSASQEPRKALLSDWMISDYRELL